MTDSDRMAAQLHGENEALAALKRVMLEHGLSFTIENIGADLHVNRHGEMIHVNIGGELDGECLP